MPVKRRWPKQRLEEPVVITLLREGKPVPATVDNKSELVDIIWLHWPAYPEELRDAGLRELGRWRDAGMDPEDAR